jgi:beta-glucosidase
VSAFDEAAKRVAGGADPDEEARGLVERMTLDEKLGCLDGDTPFWPGMVDMGQGGYYAHPWPAARVERLGIPGIHFADGPRGCVVGPSTAFPVSMARGASFDPDLERRIGEAIGKELRARGANYTGAVCLNLLRHPGWGRAQETYGEDPCHVGEMAAALTKGLQRHVMACMKHFALNSMENARFRVDVQADERALHEVYLPHFKRVVGAGVASVMSAYNSLNGEWCGENGTLLTEILREEWGFGGFVITDFSFGLRDPVKSVVAGCNVEMPHRQQRAVALPGAIESGALAVEAVDQRVVETLATLLRFAPLEATPARPEVVACAEHRALAREAAQKSMVLLRNEGALLPVDPAAVRRIAVLGRLADRPNLGDGGSSDVRQPEVVTPLAGVRAAFPDAEVRHAEGDASIVDDADLALLVVGYTARDEGEYIDPTAFAALAHLFPPRDHPATGFPPDWKPPAAGNRAAGGPGEGFAAGGDRRSLRLHAEDEALIRAAGARHPRVVVAVMAGSAVVMPWLDDVSAALLLWYPGMEGGHALADVLTGRAEPGGRLPFAIPRDEEDLVPFEVDADRATYGLLHGQWWLDRNGVAAQRPFGFGLGYTRFVLEEPTARGDRAAVTVRNVGARSGATVVQLYGAVPGSAFERPPKRLLGFARVTLEAGASRRVEIPAQRALLDVRRDGAWHREALPVELSIGLDAASARAIPAD